ncbi:hypothetical protein BKA70DRAFT_1264188 [Coprinopsis sp. MPI-PUGE-AT-0042]|nr:hypothetical protein BKA70DRAFT_1264188 [Coprinopsis sp. MPI-PUGE-AT-0042]
MLRVRFLRRAGTIEFAQRITGGTHSEWQKKLYSSAQEPPLLSAGDIVHLDKKERESLEVLNHFLKICRVTLGCFHQSISIACA